MSRPRQPSAMEGQQEPVRAFAGAVSFLQAVVAAVPQMTSRRPQVRGPPNSPRTIEVQVPAMKTGIQAWSSRRRESLRGEGAALWYVVDAAYSATRVTPRAYASPLLQNTVAPQDFFEKTRVQGGGEALFGNAVLARMSLQERKSQTAEQS